MYEDVKNDFVPVFVLGLYKNNPAIKTNVDLVTGVDLSSLKVAGLMVALVECVVDMLPESEQIKFEQETLKFFRKLVKTRFERTHKIQLDKDEE